MAICKLCLQDKSLIKQSHIIPDFLYQELYDEKHKIIAFKPHEYVKGEGHIKRPSSGEYEGGILCQDCDNRILGGFEDYASKVIFGGNLPQEETPQINNVKNQHGIELSECTNVDYIRWKLFLLSILWRASISSREYFEQVDLGPHQEILRNMILNNDPGDVDQYPIFILSFLNDSKMPKDLILTPRKIRTSEGLITYVFPIGGAFYIFYVNSRQQKLPEHILEATIKRSNQFLIAHIPRGQGWKTIFGYLGLINKSKM